MRKRDVLASAGMDPYTATSRRTHEIGQILGNFDSFADEETETVIAGRVLSLRRHGGSTFADITDGTGRIQAFFSRDTVGKRLFDLLTDTIDPGDFIEIMGVQPPLQLRTYRRCR